MNFNELKKDHHLHLTLNVIVKIPFLFIFFLVLWFKTKITII